MHPDITLEDTQLPLERSPKILGVILDPSISFHKHCNYVSDRIDKINNMLMALAGSSWGQDKETLLMTYNALGKSIANYAAPVWSTNASDSSFKKIQTAQNAALRTATGAHKMASIDHLHQESLRYIFCAVPCKLSGGGPCCCCLPTPMTPASAVFPLVVHQLASSAIWPAVQSLRRGLSTNPGVTMWCVCGCS